MKSFNFVVAFSILPLCLTLASCSRGEASFSSSSNPFLSESVGSSESTLSSSWDHGYHVEKGEDFNPNISYLGEDASSYYSMAVGYNYSPYFASLKIDYNWSELDVLYGSIIGFSYENKDIFAKKDDNKPSVIEKFVVKEKKKLTVSEIRNLGFLEKKEFEHTEVKYGFQTQCLSTEFYWTSSFTAETSFEAMTQYGMWDSLMCFLDRGGRLDQLYATRMNLVTSVLWPAFTIYSDDCTEVVGVSVLMDNGKFRTYMKEDGYDQKITPEQYAHRIRFAQENDEYFGRAAFYFEPSEFQGPGLLDYFRLLGGPIDL